MSLIEVAKIAGVSKSTVSRVINEMPGVSDEVRAKVKEAIEEVGYQPSARRRGPKPASRRGIRTGNVLLLTLGMAPQDVYRMPVFPKLFHGIETAVREAGLNLVLASFYPDEGLPASLNGDHVDGALLIDQPHIITQTLQDRLKKLICVGLMRGFEPVAGQIDRVLYNNQNVGVLAARYLKSRGHEHTAYINLDPTHAAFTQRRDVFVSCMSDDGTVLDLTESEPVLGPAKQPAAIRKAIEQIKKAKPNITAIFAASDIVVPGLYDAMSQAGIQPGKDIEVISCDNEEQFIGNLSPRPTTIDIGLEALGQQAVRQLLWRLANKDQPSRMTVMIEPALVQSPDL